MPGVTVMAGGVAGGGVDGVDAVGVFVLVGVLSGVDVCRVLGVAGCWRGDAIGVCAPGVLVSVGLRIWIGVGVLVGVAVCVGTLLAVGVVVFVGFDVLVRIGVAACVGVDIG